MARVKRSTQQPKSRLQRIIDMEAVQRGTAPLVNAFAAQHGNYAALGKLNDARHAMINRGGTPVARWVDAGLLTDSQQAAIAHCNRLWGMLNGKALVQDLLKIPGGGDGNGWAEQEALDDLARIKGHFPLKYWSVFESVCRFDEPAGYAGSRLANAKNEHCAAARITVQFVADTIAYKEHLSY
jgi:hypothetical protein